MVEGQDHPLMFPMKDPRGPFLGSAILAEVLVPSVDVSPGQHGNPDRDPLIVAQADNRRKGKAGIYIDPVVFLGDRRSLDQQLDCVLRPGDTNWFVRGIQN